MTILSPVGLATLNMPNRNPYIPINLTVGRRPFESLSQCSRCFMCLEFYLPQCFFQEPQGKNVHKVRNVMLSTPGLTHTHTYTHTDRIKYNSNNLESKHLACQKIVPVSILCLLTQHQVLVFYKADRATFCNYNTEPRIQAPRHLPMFRFSFFTC